MADFCDKCAPEMWGEDIPADIDTDQIFGSLMDEHYQDGFICEGCGLRAVGRVGDEKILIYDNTDLHRMHEMIMAKGK